MTITKDEEDGILEISTMNINNRLENVIAEFLSKYANVDIFEAVIETDVRKGKRMAPPGQLDLVPCLYLCAANIFQGESFQAAVRKTEETQDWGFLGDIMDIIGDAESAFILTDYYPNWPDDLDEGDKTIMQILKKVTLDLPKKTILLFYYVGAWPPIDIRTGKEIDVS